MTETLYDKPKYEYIGKKDLDANAGQEQLCPWRLSLIGYRYIKTEIGRVLAHLGFEMPSKSHPSKYP